MKERTTGDRRPSGLNAALTAAILQYIWICDKMKLGIIIKLVEITHFL